MSCLGEESQFIFGQTTIGLGYRFKCKKWSRIERYGLVI
jgi:hypothetical protein